MTAVIAAKVFTHIIVFTCAVINADVGTPGVVDHLGTGRSDRIPHGIEVAVVLIRTVVHVVAAARVADSNISIKRDAVGILSVAATGHNAGDVRAVRIVHTENPVAVHIKSFTLGVIALGHRTVRQLRTALFEVIEGIARTRVRVLTGRRDAENAAAREFGVGKKGTGVHNADQHTFTGVAFRVCRGSVHVHKPVLVLLLTDVAVAAVFSRFPGRGAAQAALFHISSGSSRCSENNRSSSQRHNSLGGLAVRILCFVHCHERAANVIPQRFECTVHCEKSFDGVDGPRRGKGTGLDGAI